MTRITCTRCNRTLRNPIDVDGRPYGSTCAKTFGGVRARPTEAASLTPRDPLDFDLFDGIDFDGAEIQARARVAAAVDSAAARHMAAMLADLDRRMAGLGTLQLSRAVRRRLEFLVRACVTEARGQ